MYRKKTAYIGFSTTCALGLPLGVLEHVPCVQRGTTECYHSHVVQSDFSTTHTKNITNVGNWLINMFPTGCGVHVFFPPLQQSVKA